MFTDRLPQSTVCKQDRVVVDVVRIHLCIRLFVFVIAKTFEYYAKRMHFVCCFAWHSGARTFHVVRSWFSGIVRALHAGAAVDDNAGRGRRTANVE